MTYIAYTYNEKLFIHCLFSVSKLTKELVLIRAEKSDSEREVEELQRKFKDTKLKHDTLIREGEDKSTVEQYINKIAELKR